MTATNYQDKPCAAHGWKSYRYPSTLGGFIMIGARNKREARREANRSLTIPNAPLEKVETWNPSSNRYEK